MKFILDTIISQEPMARQDIGPIREPTTVILLNGHIKLTLYDISLYLQINASLHSPQKISVSRRWKLTQLVKTKRMKERLQSSHPSVGHLYHTISCQASGINAEEDMGVLVEGEGAEKS